MRRALTLIAFLVCAAPAWAQTTIGPLIIANANDDGIEQANGNLVGNGATIGSIDTTNVWGFWRFTGITIPSGATITNAYLTVTTPNGNSDEPEVTFYGVDASAPAQPSWGGNGGISALSRTTATTLWSNTDLGASSGTYDTPAMTTLIQELVDSYAPYSSGVIAIVAHTTSANTARDLTVYGRDDATGATNAAKITITYTEASSGSPRNCMLLGVCE